jgi:glycosyltransferase involved in cell wall biosynthesis
LSSSPLAPLAIGYAGGLVPEKGVDLILRACAGLVGDWQLTLAGEGSSRAELERLAAALQIADRMRFAGRIGSDAMPMFYHELDVLVLPSRTRPNWKEQFGRVLVEAMACGVAVIGSDCGEIPQVIGGAGLVFAEEDVVGLREALQRLLDSPEERQRLAAVGRQRVLDHFTMQQIAEQTLMVYRQLVTHAHRA